MTNLDHIKQLSGQTERNYKMCEWVINKLSHDAENCIFDATLRDFANTFEISDAHFQKTFKRYVGISPKQFQQSLIMRQSKLLLPKHSIEQTSLDLGLSSSSRLHNTYVSLVAVSPGEFKSQGEKLVFNWCIEPSIFGDILVISTDRGLYYLGFHQAHTHQKLILNEINTEYPKAIIQRSPDPLLGFDPFLENKPITLSLNATNFQIKTWQALLSIEHGTLVSYKHIAQLIGQTNAFRAVAKAIGSNPIAFIIPCHRVVKASGAISGYRWGVDYKHKIQVWEHALSQRD